MTDPVLETLFLLSQKFLYQFETPEEWWTHVHLFVFYSEDDIRICENAKESKDAGVPDEIQEQLMTTLKEHMARGETYAYAAIRKEAGWEFAAIPGTTQEEAQKAETLGEIPELEYLSES
jgi:hypothetical protein